MKKLQKNAGSVRYRTDKSGVTVAEYGGAMCAKTLVHLRDSVAAQAPETLAYVVRLDRTCLMMGIDPFIPTPGDVSALPGGVVVCRPDQLDAMKAYARHMAERGVVRVVFLESEVQEALHFAAFHASLRQSPR